MNLKTEPILNKNWLSNDQLKLFTQERTNAHRLYSGSQVCIERFGEDILISYKNEVARDAAMNDFLIWSQIHGLKYQRVFGRYLPKQNPDRNVPSLLKGDTQPGKQTVVTEYGLKFSVDFGAGYSVGLFIDQRANRSFLRSVRPKRLLNCFAYTCSFSVVAAMEGSETMSVDLSKKSLQRGKDNFKLNGLELSQHRFLADDVMDVLPNLARKGEKFDAVILDPPTFSRGVKGRLFQVEKHFEDLLLKALELADRNAKILMSTNCMKMNRRTLESIAHFCLKATRVQGSFYQEPPLPDIPADFSAQTLWLLLR